MKKLVALFLLVSLTNVAFSQQPLSGAPTSEELLQKSKSQKTIAWVLVGGGVALAGGAVLWAGSDWYSNGPDVMAVAAGASVLTSIPFFIASSRNRRKAATVSFRIERLPEILTQRATLSSVSLNIPLNGR
ncbi:MAG TPA: hypothetical protein VEB63_05005 [Chitinophagaceae bacterium]|nr:hypothetical protein [Chitinophagaceae bacterium]